MSNDPRDELFGDDDDFGFDDDEDIFGSDDNLLDDDDDLAGFGDDEDDFDLSGFDELDDEADLDDPLLISDDEDFTLDDEELEEDEGGGGPSRTFIIIAVLMIVILLAGVGLLAFAILGQGPSELDVTRTAIAQANATVEEQIRQTETQSAINAVTQTAEALISPTPSDTPTPSETPTEEIDLTGTAEAEEEEAAANLFLTQTAAAASPTPTATETVLAPPQEETDDDMPTTVPTISESDVAMTATALAGIFDTEPTAVISQPTAAVGATPGGGATGGPIGGELPDTGLFDEMGTGGVGMFFLMVFGLLGVIFVSRRMRAGINKDS